MKKLLPLFLLPVLWSCGNGDEPAKKDEKTAAAVKGETWSGGFYDYSDQKLYRYDLTFFGQDSIYVRAEKNIYVDNDAPFQGGFKIKDTVRLDDATKDIGGLLLVAYNDGKSTSYTYLPLLRTAGDRMRVEAGSVLGLGKAMHSYHHMDEESPSRYFDDLDSLRAYVAIFEDDFYFAQTSYFYPEALYNEMVKWPAPEIKTVDELKRLLADMTKMVDAKFAFYEKMRIDDTDGYREDYFISQKNNPYLGIENMNAVYREHLDETEMIMKTFMSHTPAMEKLRAAGDL